MKDTRLLLLSKQKRSINLTEYKPKNKVAYVFGNEVNGVSKKTLDSSNLIVEIPQFGNKKSMNVTVCAGIVLWDFHNKKGSKKTLFLKKFLVINYSIINSTLLFILLKFLET